MSWDFNDDRPIYMQLMEQIQLRIVSGIYKAGEKLPSVRDMAGDAAVNPNTMQKALTELERTGLVFSQRTSGRFITEDVNMIKNIRNGLARDQIEKFLHNMEKNRLYQSRDNPTYRNYIKGDEIMSNDDNKILYNSSESDTMSTFTDSNMDNVPILECRNLFKTYSNTEALKGINLKINRGRIVGLLGPNGSGKSTLIKLANGLLTPSSGEILISGNKPGIETKKIVSYLPERTYLNDWMKVSDIISFFQDFYDNFNPEKAYNMLSKLNINPNDKLKTMSKGTKEKVQLILVMSREADLYLLDEPIAGVDPAARDYILNTIITNYNENATIIISTHLISDIERILDDVVFISYGNIFLTKSVDEIRENEGKSVDALFREVFRC